MFPDGTDGEAFGNSLTLGERMGGDGGTHSTSEGPPAAPYAVVSGSDTGDIELTPLGSPPPGQALDLEALQRSVEGLCEHGMPPAVCSQCVSLSRSVSDGDGGTTVLNLNQDQEPDEVQALTLHIPAAGLDYLDLAPLTAQRQQWAKEGKALPDGSWPIPNVAYLAKACQAFPGRAKGQEGRIKAWILKRAKALNAMNHPALGRVQSYSINASQRSEHALSLQTLALDHTAGEGGVIWKVLCKTGTLALSPGPGQVDVEKPLNLTADMFNAVKQAYDDRAFEHVTVPETHANGTLENTGVVQSLETLSKQQALQDTRLSQGTKDTFTADPDDTQYLLGGIHFTDPKAREKAANGSILNCSVGLKFNYRRKRDGKLYPVALEHVALTNQPWVDGLGAFGGQLSQQQPFNWDEQPVWDGVFVHHDAPTSSEASLSPPSADATVLSVEPNSLPGGPAVPGADAGGEPTLEQILANQQATIERLEAELTSANNQLGLAQSQLGDQGYELHEARINRRITELQGLGVNPAVLVRAKALMLAAYSPTGEGTLQLSVREGDSTVTKDFGPIDQVEYLLAAMPRGQASAAVEMAHQAATDSLRLSQVEHERKEQTTAEKADEVERQLHPERFDADGKRMSASERGKAA